MKTKNYVFFIHGVNTHKEKAFEICASDLFNNIAYALSGTGISLSPINFFWGDLAIPLQDTLVQGMKRSPAFSSFWFRSFRTDTILPFVGDAALYLSRHIGCEIVMRLRGTLAAAIQDRSYDRKRIHLVAHSLGSVILFDILFSGRWNDPSLDAPIRAAVAEIRDAFFGLGAHPGSGVEIASIHTMGSPIALFSLLSATGSSSHNLAPDMRKLLDSLYARTGRPTPWRNFAHPGDPIAYPLEGLITTLLDDGGEHIDMRDVITDNGSLFGALFQQTKLPLLWTGDAHGSYWYDRTVSNRIAAEIRQSAA